MQAKKSKCTCNIKIPSDKTMRPTTKYFKMNSPVYKGNPVLNAQKKCLMILSCTYLMQDL